MNRVTDALDRYAEARPDAPAVVDGETVLDWAQLRAAVDESAAALGDAGVGPGTAVALRARDGASALVAALATIRAGGVHAPIDHALAPPEVATALAALHAPWFIDLDHDPAPRATGHQAPSALGAVRAAFVRASSGTTGSAKGVVLSHDAVLTRGAVAASALGLEPGRRVLWCLPMAYHFAVSILAFLAHGCTLVFGAALRASRTAAIARDHGVELAYLSPWHIAQLARLGPGNDLPPSLGTVVSTTTALPPAHAEAFHARHGLWPRQALGIIEIGLPFVASAAPPPCSGHLGHPLPGYDVRIAAADGQPLPAGEDGHLLLAGPGLFDAYLDPWRGRDEVLVDGRWFDTGDLARIGVDGTVQLLGRAKELINVGGIKVFPIEVEAVLDAHPKVAASRVVSAADERLGEHVAAEVEATVGEGGEGLVDELRRWCRERLAPLKQPAAITVVARLPRTPSGKVMRRG